MLHVSSTVFDEFDILIIRTSIDKALVNMSSVSWIAAEDLGSWDAFVLRHPLGLAYHLSAWRSVLEGTFDHIRGKIVVVKDENGEIRSGLPIYNIRSWLLKNRTVSVPFATFCDPLISSREDFILLWKAVEEMARESGSRRIEIRTRRMDSNLIPAPLVAGARYKHHYLPLSGSIDELFRRLHPSCIRRRLQQAKRTGLTVERRQDIQSVRCLHSLLVATRRRLGLPPIPVDLFEAAFRYLSSDRVGVYLAISRGTPVGGALAVKFKDMWTAEYSGHADGAPPGTDQYVYWHMIECAKNSGAASFSFGRTSLDNQGLLDYKRRWATIEEDLTDYVAYPGRTPRATESAKTVHPAFYLSARLLRYTPTHIQKCFGDFCYRHLG